MLPRADWPSVLEIGQRAVALLDATAPVDAIVGYDAAHVPLETASPRYADTETRTPRPRAARALRRAALGEATS